MNTKCTECYTLTLAVTLAAPDVYQAQLDKLNAHRRVCAVYQGGQAERYTLARAQAHQCQDGHTWQELDGWRYCTVCGWVEIGEAE